VLIDGSVAVTVGHAQTFFIAKQRAEKYHGELVLRIEDIDIQRCKPHFLPDMVEDLTWFGLQPSEGYGTTTSVHDDFVQSKRFDLYKQAWKILYDQGYIYPCTLSRRDVEHALSAPQDTSHTASQAEATPTPTATATATSGTTNIPNEPVLPAELRPDFVRATPYRPGDHAHFPEKFQHLQAPTDMRINWRFRVPDYTSPDVDEAHDASIAFDDVSCGTQAFTAMRDYGDFLVWRLDGYPSYELAVVVDDILMGVTEVVRGQDLLISTCRQLLLMRAIFGLDFRQRRCWHAPADVGAPIGGLREKQEAEGKAAAVGEAEEDIDGESPAQKRARNDSLSDHHPAASSSSVPAQTPSTWHYARLSSHPTGSILDGSAYFRIPQYYHAPLMCDEDGRRLAKRNFAKSLRKMREEGLSPTEIQAKYFHSAFLSSPTL
jgi:glutamyl-tRNA synthetase